MMMLDNDDVLDDARAILISDTDIEEYYSGVVSARFKIKL